MSSTFPSAYYGKTASTKLTTTNATAILDIPSVSAGRGKSRLILQVIIKNDDASSTCEYTLTVYRGEDSTTYGLFQATLAAKATAVHELTGFVLTPSDELRLTAENANDLVATVTFMEDLGGST